MSTTPTEAHRRLVREMALQGQYLNRSIEHYAQEIADSEARAVERWSGGLDMSLPDLYEAAKSERAKASAALSAERERVRVLEEALREADDCLHALAKIYPTLVHEIYGDAEHRTDAALAATDEKET